MVKTTAISIGILFLLFLLIRVIQAIIHHRRFMAEYKNPTTHPLSKINSKNVPENICHLVPMAEKWAIGDDFERSKMQRASSLQEKQEFVNATWPFMEEIDKWVNQEHEKVPVSYEATIFMFLSEAAAEIKGELDQL